MGQAFRLGVTEERRHPGLRTTLHLVDQLPGVALSSAHIPDDADVHFEGTVEAQGIQVIVQGVARAPWVGECRRCLETTSGEIEVELREIFDQSPVEDETFPLEDDEIDLAPVLRQALALVLPLAPLCSEDCPGPDPGAHPVGFDDEAEGAAKPRDPRWAALDELRFDASTD